MERLPKIKRNYRPKTVFDIPQNRFKTLQRPFSSLPLLRENEFDGLNFLKLERKNEDLEMSIFSEEVNSDISELERKLHEIQSGSQKNVEKKKTEIFRKRITKVARMNSAASTLQKKEITIDEIERRIRGLKLNSSQPFSLNDTLHSTGKESKDRKKDDKRKKQKKTFRKENHLTVKEIIHRLQNNEDELRAFKKRVHKIKKERSNVKKKNYNRTNIINRNVDHVKYMTRKTMYHEREEKLRSLEKRRQNVLEKVKQKNDFRQRLLIEDVKEREYQREKQLRNLENRPARLKLLDRQRKLVPLVLYSTVMQNIVLSIKQGRSNKAYQEELKDAIRIVRKYMLPKIIKRREKKVKIAKEVLRQNLWYWIVIHRVRKSRNHLGVLRSVVLSLENSNRFSKQVHSFINHVKKSQQSVREHLLKREAQVKILTNYWEMLKVQVFREQLEDDIESYRADVEQQVQALFKGLFQKQNQQNLNEKVKKTMKSREIKLKELVKVMLPKKQRKSRTRENVVILLDRLRSRGKVKMEELKAATRIVPVAWRMRCEIHEPIRDRLIIQDLTTRSKRFRERLISSKGEQKEYFSLLPPISEYKSLILQAQEMSKNREDAMLRIQAKHLQKEKEKSPSKRNKNTEENSANSKNEKEE